MLVLFFGTGVSFGKTLGHELYPWKPENRFLNSIKSGDGPIAFKPGSKNREKIRLSEYIYFVRVILKSYRGFGRKTRKKNKFPELSGQTCICGVLQTAQVCIGFESHPRHALIWKFKTRNWAYRTDTHGSSTPGIRIRGRISDIGIGSGDTGIRISGNPVSDRAAANLTPDSDSPGRTSMCVSPFADIPRF